MATIRVTQRDVGSTRFRVLAVDGELDLADVVRLQGPLDEAAAEHEAVVVALENCDFIDSMALAVLVTAHHRFSEQGQRLVICGPNAQVCHLLDYSGLNKDGLVFDSLEHALSSV